MLYINHDIEQTLHIPATIAVGADTILQLVLHSTMNIGDDCTVSVQKALTQDGRYIKAEIEFNELPQDGEYEYALVSNGTIVSAGLAQIGQYNNETTQYEREIEYRQYEG